MEPAEAFVRGGVFAETSGGSIVIVLLHADEAFGGVLQPLLQSLRGAGSEAFEFVNAFADVERRRRVCVGAR